MSKTFSYEIKKELSEINNLAKKNEVKYELLGYLSSSNIEKKKNRIKYVTENEYNINRFGKLLKNVDINDFKIELQGKVYVIKSKIPELSEKLEQANELEERAFVRGIFLGSGSINNPNNKYHLEIKINNK